VISKILDMPLEPRSAKPGLHQFEVRLTYPRRRILAGVTHEGVRLNRKYTAWAVRPIVTSPITQRHGDAGQVVLYASIWTTCAGTAAFYRGNQFCKMSFTTGRLRPVYVVAKEQN